jgi:hypothetical protein
MRQPAQNRVVANDQVAANERLAREIEDLAEKVRRHPELHHDNADRLLLLARRLHGSGVKAKAKRPARRTATKR